MTIVNKCKTCFYALMDKDLEPPCTSCSGYSNWVPHDMYSEPLTKPDFSTLSQSINNWFQQQKTGYKIVNNNKYDVVDKPKHYMLFAADELRKEEGIEVRDVIEQLMKRIYVAYNEPGNMTISTSPMFDSDYVQLMQYLMRFMDKNGLEDLKKARWYLDKVIQAYAGDSYESNL